MSTLLTKLSSSLLPDYGILRFMKGNFLYKRIGDRIVSLRKKIDITQEGLAFACHMDRTYLARIEEGKANPSIRILHKISRILRVKMCDILSGL